MLVLSIIIIISEGGGMDGCEGVLMDGEKTRDDQHTEDALRRYARRPP